MSVYANTEAERKAVECCQYAEQIRRLGGRVAGDIIEIGRRLTESS
jgi:hypothetical protein